MSRLSRSLVSISRGCRGYERGLEQNWCGNVHFHSSKSHMPESMAELQDIVRATAAAPVRVVGRGHSFSPIAECAGGTLISLTHLNKIIDFEAPDVDQQGSVGSITIEGGTTYTEVARFLAQGRRGALRNLPSCPQFTVAGAIATATHGSGVHLANLASDVSMIEFVRADGQLVRYDREASRELLEGCRVHLGCLGVVSQLRLDVVPFFDVDARTYMDMPLESTLQSLPELWRRCDSLSVWTAGFGHGPGAGTCWVTLRHFVPHWDETRRAPGPTPLEPALLGESGSLMQRPINRYCTEVGSPQTTIFSPTRVGPWYSHLTLTLDDECEETSMGVVDLQAEFFVPLEHAQPAMRALWEAASGWTFSSPPMDTAPPVKGLVDAMEFRQVKGDGAWLSPQPVDSLGIHISFNGDPERRAEVMRALAARVLERFFSCPPLDMHACTPAHMHTYVQVRCLSSRRRSTRLERGHTGASLARRRWRPLGWRSSMATSSAAFALSVKSTTLRASSGMST